MQDPTPEWVAAASAAERKAAFLEFALGRQVLRFGDFALKSGRQSPYFFNCGEFRDGAALSLLGAFYAAEVQASELACDVLFGPAYKGIPLGVAAVAALARDHGRNLGLTYNRKEAKDHGEGGQLVGASLQGQRVLLVDDVITAGTAIREVLPLIESAGGRLVGVLTALDRQERGQGERSAVQELRAELGLPVLSLVTLADLEAWLAAGDDQTVLAQVRAYRAAYGALA